MSEYTNEENVGYHVVKAYLAGDVRAKRCYASLSSEEQQRLLSGAQCVRGQEDASRYVWEYLNERGE